MQITPVILSGGSGQRLWPLSRKEYPKQYLKLLGDNTMLQETIMRLDGLDNILNPIIVCNADHRFLVAEQCRQIGVKNPTILLEPAVRNTAPAIAAAALKSLKDSDISTLLVLSTDHVIQDVHAFHEAIKIASYHAQKNRLVTFGILPTEADTGFGYIKLSKDKNNGANRVEEFVEKPDKKTALFYLEQANYLWNSGMFMFQARTFIDELKIQSPNIVEAVNKAINYSSQDLDFIRPQKQAFELSPSKSVDYALFEKSNNVMVVPLDAQWKDIGNWKALYDIGMKDSQGNVIKGDVITNDTTNTYINAEQHMVVALGVDNLIIMDTPDVTFVASQEKAENVTNIVESLQNSCRGEVIEHRKVYRPWGWYDIIESGEHFKVKRLHVKSGEKLSLQMHRKRAEHWVVITGKATVTKGEKIFTLNKDESTYIPIKTLHCIENQTDKCLEIIEVQSGTYLGEDDIVRFSDNYNRVIKKEY